MIGFYDLPMDIIRLIYEFDPSYYDLFKDEVKSELEFEMFDHFRILESGFTIRNFQSNINNRQYRYYDVFEDRMKGSYIRGFWSSKCPL